MLNLTILYETNSLLAGFVAFMIGIVLAFVQGFFSYYWMKRHKQGPLETIWHKLTWINFKKK